MNNTADNNVPIVADVKLLFVITANHCQKLWRIIVISPVTQIVRTSTACMPLSLASQNIIWTDQLQAK